MRQRFQTAQSLSTYTLTPEDFKFLDAFFDVDDESALHLESDETIDLSTVTADAVDTGLKLLDMQFVLGLEHDGTVSSNPAIQVWTGASKTGTQFDIIADGANFGAASARQCRVWNETGRIDFAVAQLDDLWGAGSHSEIFVTYYGSYSWESATKRLAMAKMGQIKTAVAGETLADNSLGYINTGDSNKIHVFDDPSSQAQAEGLVVVLKGGASGDTVFYCTQGEFTPSTSPTAGKALFAGNNSELTYAGDSSGNELTTGDYRVPVGKSQDGTIVLVNIGGIQGVQA